RAGARRSAADREQPLLQQIKRRGEPQAWVSSCSAVQLSNPMCELPTKPNNNKWLRLFRLSKCAPRLPKSSLLFSGSVLNRHAHQPPCPTPAERRVLPQLIHRGAHSSASGAAPECPSRCFERCTQRAASAGFVGCS